MGGVQDTALQALSFPPRVTIAPCHPPHHVCLWCIVGHHQNNGRGLGAIIPRTDHQKVHQQTTLWLSSGGEVAGLGITLAIPLTRLHLHLSESVQTLPTSQSILATEIVLQTLPGSQLADVVVTVE